MSGWLHQLEGDRAHGGVRGQVVFIMVAECACHAQHSGDQHREGGEEVTICLENAPVRPATGVEQQAVLRALDALCRLILLQA